LKICHEVPQVEQGGCSKAIAVLLHSSVEDERLNKSSLLSGVSLLILFQCSVVQNKHFF